jgi:NADH-quinone oxidoreductase subunit G
MAKDIKITIDSKECTCKEGEFILNVARANDIFIPAICYITRCSPTLACRVCLVDIDGKQAYGCNAKAKDGMTVTTTTENIELERNHIMQVYDINHPLQCGVCDMSGECELQNYTLEMKVDTQNYAIPDVNRPTKDWGLRKYDPGLCIVCEKCVTVCKDMIGDSALKTIPRGGLPLEKELKDTMPKDTYAVWNKLNKSLIGGVAGDNYECSDCGECTAVCPVGALVSTDFQYTTNAWELEKIPATCAHCSNGCSIYYEVKHGQIANPEEKIYRVTNEYHYNNLCAAGRYGYDFENRNVTKDSESFAKAVESLKTAKNVEFTSQITNEEAFILEKLREKLGFNLVNDEALAFQNFLENYSTTSGNKLYSANRDDVHNSNFIAVIGTQLRTDSPVTRYAVNNSMKMNKGAGLYFHPVGDNLIDSLSKTMISVNHNPYEEEAALYLLLDLFGKDLPEDTKTYLDSFHETRTKTVTETIKEKIVEKVVNPETGEEEEKTKMVPKKVSKEVEFDYCKLLDKLGLTESFYDDFEKALAKKDSFSLVVGSDLFTHPKAQNLAKLVGLIDKYTEFRVLIIPSNTNTLGVSQICTLSQKSDGMTVGYNVKADFTISANGNGNLDVPALNQQEGTFTNINKRVVPTNAALEFGGYELNDLAKEILTINEFNEYTIDYTKQLPTNKGFKAEKFDDLPNYFGNDAVEYRGYVLDNNCVQACTKVEQITDVSKSFDDNIIYLANPEMQFNEFTNKSHQLKSKAVVLISSEFAKDNGLENENIVKLSNNNGSIELSVKIDAYLKGNILCVSSFDTTVDTKSLFDSSYRFSYATLTKG